MTVLVTSDEMRAAEHALFDAGMPSPDLMYRAALEMANWIDHHFDRRTDCRAVALVGPRNNGGDALVTLALLAERGWRAEAILFDRTEFGDLPATPEQLAKLELVTIDDLADACLILDGVYGIGGKASLPAHIETAFSAAYAARTNRNVPLIAIDVPSGIDATTGEAAPGAFQADITLCLGLPKMGLLREPASTYVGEFVLLDIGVPEPVIQDRPRLISEARTRLHVPRRTSFAHKHNVGSVLVIGGAPTYYGAPRLAGEAALRSGAGLVALAVPERLVPIIAGQVPELVFIPLPEDDGRAAAARVHSFLEDRSGTIRAIVVGPGLGRSEHVDALLTELLDQPATSGSVIDRLPFVFDADALNWIAARGAMPRGIVPGRAVLTPHAGELARLMNVSTSEVLSNPAEIAKQAAWRFEQTVVLKLGHTVVADPHGHVALSPRTTPELATAGTGDVLAGLIGGLLAQLPGEDRFDVACSAVFVGSRAGLRAREKFGTLGVTATDVISQLPPVIKSIVDASLHV